MKNRRQREHTRTVGDAGILQFTSSRELNEFSLLNTQALGLWATLVDLLDDVAQALRGTVLNLGGRVAALLRRSRRLRRREAQARHQLLHHLPALPRQIICSPASLHHPHQQQAHPQVQAGSTSPLLHLHLLLLLLGILGGFHADAVVQFWFLWLCFHS